MATAYTDTVNGQPITVAINAAAWQEPAITSWWARCRELNRLLKDATHLLKIESEDAEPTWYAGVAGTSLAAGIERMAISHDELRGSIVAFPLDTRIYVADLPKRLVAQEWVLYSDAFENHVRTWREEGRKFTLLTGGGRQDVDMPNAAQVPVDIDTGAMSFRHASLSLLVAGLLCWRDCVAAFGIIVLAVSLSFAATWWQRAPTIEPLKRVAALVSQQASPVRYTASAELAKLALLAAEHDAVLWQIHDATELRYDTLRGTVELHSSTVAPISTSMGALPVSPEVPTLLPYTINAFQTTLAALLESSAWMLTFGDPYPIGTAAELEQHLTISVGSTDEPFEHSIPLALIDLSERLTRLPVTLHYANCSVVEGRFAACELSFTIRGTSV